MKKYVLFTFSMLMLSLLSFGQDFLVVTAEGEPIANNHVCLSGTPDAELIADCAIKNTGTETINIGIKMYVQTIAEGSNFQLCFSDGCLSPGNYETDKTVDIAAGEMDKSFSCHYNYNDNLGLAKAMFTFFNTENPADSIAIVYDFTVSYISILDEEGNIVEGGSMILFPMHPDSGEVELKMQVKNLSLDTLSIMSAKNVLVDLENTTNVFCWGACFPPNVDTCNQPLKIAGGAVNENDFSAHFSPQGVVGDALIEYFFYDQMNPQDKISVQIAFISQDNTGIENLSEYVRISNAYPNPANQAFQIDYSFDKNYSEASLELYNTLGARVNAISIHDMSGKVIVDTKDLANGVYFYTFRVDQQVISTKKLIISK